MKTIISIVLAIMFLPTCALSQIRVGVLLPLEENTDRGSKMIEFYRGLLMAADSVRKEGISIDIHAWHSGSTIAEINQVLSNPEVETMQVIFGPADQAQAYSLTQFCNLRGIRHVVPFSIPGTGIANRPRYYQTCASSALVQKEAVKSFVNSHQESRYILLHSDKTEDKGRNLHDAIRNYLNTLGLQAPIQLDMTSDLSNYASVMSPSHENILIPDNASIVTLNQMFSELSAVISAHPDYKIALFGYPEWQTYTSNLLPQFYTWDTYIYSPYYRNPLSKATARFEKEYANLFGQSTQETFPRYGMMGFDMGYYFMHGLARFGDELESMGWMISQQPYQNAYRFIQTSQQDGLINSHVYIVRYTPQHTIEVNRQD